jgi:hypothetical protein
MWRCEVNKDGILCVKIILLYLVIAPPEVGLSLFLCVLSAPEKHESVNYNWD